MTEKVNPKIEKQDIKAPSLAAGDTAIVLQRHERYSRDRDQENAGSIFEDVAAEALKRDEEFFQTLIDQEKKDGIPTKVLFVSSDTQYAGKGYRSLETAQLAQDAAKQVFEKAGIDPSGRVINMTDEYEVERHEPTDQDIHPLKTMVEPQIFDNLDYVNFLRDKYGAEQGPGNGMSPAAWGVHEADGEKEVRESLGAEGVHDILERTKLSLAVLESFSMIFHDEHPDERLVIWVATHYDTISPLVKDATQTDFEEYVPVDYGAGVVIEIPKGSDELLLTTHDIKTKIDLGDVAAKSAAKYFQ